MKRRAMVLVVFGTATLAPTSMLPFRVLVYLFLPRLPRPPVYTTLCPFCSDRYLIWPARSRPVLRKMGAAIATASCDQAGPAPGPERCPRWNWAGVIPSRATRRAADGWAGAWPPHASLLDGVGGLRESWMHCLPSMALWRARAGDVWGGRHVARNPNTPRGTGPTRCNGVQSPVRRALVDSICATL